MLRGALVCHSCALARLLVAFHFFSTATVAAIGADLRGRRLAPSSSGVLYATSRELRRTPSNALPTAPRDVELFRFVTAYKAGMEALVDLTPYSPLLKAAAKAGNITMYSFIDSWVGNDTASKILYMNNRTHMCHPRNTSQGNGWGVSADLLFWPKSKLQHVSTHPRESIAIVPGYYGGSFEGVGAVTIHRGQVAEGGKSILFEKAPDFSTTHSALVYNLNESKNIGIASLLGYVAQQTELFTISNNPSGVKYVTEDAHDALLEAHLAPVSNILEVSHTEKKIWAKYNGSLLDWKVDMPVFFGDGVYSDKEFDNGWWLNYSLPLKPVGRISHADGENVTLEMQYPCLPCNETFHLPMLLVPVAPWVTQRVSNMVHKAQLVGERNALETQTSPTDGEDMNEINLRRARSPFLLEWSIKPETKFAISNHSVSERLRLLEPENASFLASPPTLGWLDLRARRNTTHGMFIPLGHHSGDPLNLSDGTNVSIIAQERHGRLLEKSFELPNLEFGDRILMNLAVTGHGWASTLEQCGEYCHAVYQIKLNNRSFANVTQFRDDCKDNPIHLQSGTWDESRNGWCPGTVIPGLFMDMTQHSVPGVNSVAIDLVVWSNATLQYEPYTDYAGFIFSDSASLIINMHAFVYDKAAVDHITSRYPLTAAEAAMHYGSSEPKRLKPPANIQEQSLQDVLLELGAKGGQKSSRLLRRRHQIRHPVLSWRHVRAMLPQQSSFLSRSRYIQHRHEDVPAVGHIAAEAPLHAARDAIIRHHRQLATARVSSHAEVSETRVSETPVSFNFSHRAPWYLFNRSDEGDVPEAIKFPVFQQRLQQASSRDIQEVVTSAQYFPEWSQVALYFRLHAPPAHLEMDHWDRVGSVGLRFS